MGVTKYVLPVIVGAMAGMILISFGEHGMQILYPLPPGTDLYDADSLAKYIKILPTSAFVVLIANYIVCSFLAGIIATLVAKRESPKPAVIVGIVLTLAGGVYNAVITPQPFWVSAVSILIFLPFVYLGYWVVRKKQAVV